MADGVAKEHWNHTAQLLATLCEINRNPKQRRRPFSPDEFHPYLTRRRRSGTPYTKRLLRAQAQRWFEKHGSQPHRQPEDR
jgi:hypothetical protein